MKCAVGQCRLVGEPEARQIAAGAAVSRTALVAWSHRQCGELLSVIGRWPSSRESVRRSASVERPGRMLGAEIRPFSSPQVLGAEGLYA